MTRITSATVALLLLSTFATAGGDIAPAQEPEVTVPEIVEGSNPTNFYVGLGYSYMTMNDDTANIDITGNAITVLAGYNFHKYIAVEGRYSATLGDLSVDSGTTDVDESWDMSNVALYLKPQYAMDKFTLYGLLGYGQVTLDDGTSHSEDGFQWGLGANFSATDTIDVFVDYTRLYDDDGFDTFTANNDISVDSINVGINYHF